ITRRALPVLALTLTLVLVGCGGVQGKYSHEEKGPDGSMGKMTLELKSGGKATVTMSGGGNSMSSEGTYTVDGDKVSITFQGDTQVLTKSGSKLTGKMMGESIEFVKE
ncbi:MAG TPA: lipocalin family protein, partial [Phycisphaerales bacterium]|nr:lipocalin family protein [Phycisphaerales bacterium]